MALGTRNCVNIGISGPGVVNTVVSNLPKDADLGQVSEAIKRMPLRLLGNL